MDLKCRIKKYRLLLFIIIVVVSCSKTENNKQIPNGIYINKRNPSDEICVIKNKLHIKMNFESKLKINNRFIDKDYNYMIEDDGEIFLNPTISNDPISSYQFDWDCKNNLIIMQNLNGEIYYWKKKKNN